MENKKLLNKFVATEMSIIHENLFRVFKSFNPIRDVLLEISEIDFNNRSDVKKHRDRILEKLNK
jgi:hypothetical protein